MNGALLSTLTQLTLSVTALACLALSMDQHARHAKLKIKFKRRWRQVRLAGWLLLTVALASTLTSSNWGFGLMSLLGVLSLSAVFVVGILTYRPKFLVATAAGNAVVGAVLLGCNWVG